jgi:hypothetical protein
MAYPPLQLGQAGQPKCPNKYNEESSLLCPQSKRLVIQVSKQAVYIQVGIMPQGIGASLGAVVWQPEQPFLPMIASLGRNFDAVRVRNYTEGSEAQIFLTAEP